jgi:hypothetical protein
MLPELTYDKGPEEQIRINQAAAHWAGSPIDEVQTFDIAEIQD